MSANKVFLILTRHITTGMYAMPVLCGVLRAEMTVKTKSKKPDDADSSMMYQSVSSVVSPGGDIVVSLVFNNNPSLSLGTFQYYLI